MSMEMWGVMCIIFFVILLLILNKIGNAKRDNQYYN
jgi:hypothetical protein